MKNWLPLRRLSRSALRFYAVAVVLSVVSAVTAMHRYQFRWSAGGIVSSVLVLLIFWFAIAAIHNTRIRFSMRGILAITTLIAIACGWFANRCLQARRTERVTASIREVGGTVHHGFLVDLDGWFRLPGGMVLPNQLREMMGDGFFAKPQSVYFPPRNEATDEHVAMLSAFDALRRLDLGNTRATGRSLAVVHKLPKLRVVVLRADQLNDDAVAHLDGAPNQLRVQLAHPYLLRADKDTKHIKRFSGISEVQLGGKRVSNKSMERLAGIRSINRLVVARTKITSDGLMAVRKLPNLSVLVVYGDVLTAEHLLSLAELPQLSQLGLIGTKLKKSDLQKFTQANPQCLVRFSRPKSPYLSYSVPRKATAAEKTAERNGQQKGNR